MSSERAVIFDLHDTLVHLLPSTEEAMAAILEVDVKDYTAAWHVIDRRIEEGSWTPSNDDRWVELYGGLVDMLQLSFGPQEVATRFSRLFRSVDSYAPFAEVPQTLAELRALGLRVAVLSNSDFPLEPILDACGIGSFVEVAIPAVMYGTTKPRPEAFMLCCDALNWRLQIAGSSAIA